MLLCETMSNLQINVQKPSGVNINDFSCFNANQFLIRSSLAGSDIAVIRNTPSTCLRFYIYVSQTYIQ